MSPVKSTRKTTTKKKSSSGLTEGEKAALKATLAERRAAAKGEDGERALLEAIAAMTGSDRTMAKRFHEIVTASAPSLSAKTWYGMPAYANEDGKVVCFFKSARKFKSRYATFGFEEAANLDDGAMWPVAFALKEMTAADEAKIGALVKKAAKARF